MKRHRPNRESLRAKKTDGHRMPHRMPPSVFFATFCNWKYRLIVILFEKVPDFGYKKKHVGNFRFNVIFWWSVRPIENLWESTIFKALRVFPHYFFAVFSLRWLRIFHPKVNLVFDPKDVRFIHAKRLTEGSACFIGHIIQGVRPAGSCIPAANPCTLSSIPA